MFMFGNEPPPRARRWFSGAISALPKSLYFCLYCIQFGRVMAGYFLASRSAR